jgi:hypothetical protein
MTHSFTFGLPGIVPIKIEIMPSRDVKLRTIKLSVQVTQVPRNRDDLEPGHPDVSPLALYKHTLTDLFEGFNPLSYSTDDDPCPYLLVAQRPVQP